MQRREKTPYRHLTFPPHLKAACENIGGGGGGSSGGGGGSRTQIVVVCSGDVCMYGHLRSAKY